MNSELNIYVTYYSNLTINVSSLLLKKYPSEYDLK